MVAQVAVAGDSVRMDSVLLALAAGGFTGLFVGLRIGVWYTLRKIGKYEFRNRRTNIGNTKWWGGG